MFHWNVHAFFLYKFTASYSSASSTPSDLYSFLLPQDCETDTPDPDHVQRPEVKPVVPDFRKSVK